MSYPASDKAIYEKLSANAQIVAAVGTVDGQLQIYNSFVPVEATLPYVYFYNLTDIPDYQTLREAQDDTWTVEVVAASAADARTIIGYVEDALQKQTLTYSGWSNYSTLIMERRYRVEVEDRTPYYCRHVDVQLRWSKSSV